MDKFYQHHPSATSSSSNNNNFLRARDSLSILRRHGNRLHHHYDDNNNNQHLTPFEQLKQQVLLKQQQHELALEQEQHAKEAEQAQQKRKMEPQGHSALTKRRRTSKTSKTVKFDIARNEIYEVDATVEDLQAAWYNEDDYRRVKRHLFGTVQAYQQKLNGVCMRGLEHHASKDITRERIRRGMFFRQRVLAEQARSKQSRRLASCPDLHAQVQSNDEDENETNIGTADSCPMSAVSKHLSLEDVRLAADIAALDAAVANRIHLKEQLLNSNTSSSNNNNALFLMQQQRRNSLVLQQQHEKLLMKMMEQTQQQTQKHQQQQKKQKQQQLGSVLNKALTVNMSK